MKGWMPYVIFAVLATAVESYCSNDTNRHPIVCKEVKDILTCTVK